MLRDHDGLGGGAGGGFILEFDGVREGLAGLDVTRRAESDRPAKVVGVAGKQQEDMLEIEAIITQRLELGQQLLRREPT